MIPGSFSIKSIAIIFLGTVFLLLSWMVVDPAEAGTLLVNGAWTYSKSDSGAARDSQSYRVSYGGNADITDLIGVSGSIRYTKNISGNLDDDMVGSSLRLQNTNDLYRFSLGGTYTFRTPSQGPDTDNWSWRSRLSSAWLPNSIWPHLALSFGQNGSSRDGVKQGTSDFAGFDTSWAYFNWLRFHYNADWSQARSVAGISTGESLKQRANLQISKSFWDNRGFFSFGQYYDIQEFESTNLVTSGGFLEPVTVSQVFSEEIVDPSDNVLTNNVSNLLPPSSAPPLTIDPSNPPMNLIMFIASRDVEVARLWTINDINSFYQSITWRLYQGPNGTDNWTLVTSGTLGPGDYDQVEQRITIDFGTVVNSEYIKLVLELPDLFDIPPGELTDLETIELFRSAASVTTSREEENWGSSYTMGFRLTDTINMSYSGNYSAREGTDTRARESVTNGGSVSWTPNRYFQTRINAGDSRLNIEGEEENISRNYALSVSSEPLATLGVRGGFSRNESYTGSTLDSASDSYSIKVSAQLYRDLHASLNMFYTMPQEGGGSDTFNSDLRMTARLAPILLLDWTSSYDHVLDTDTYNFNNSFNLSWRNSEFMYINTNLGIDYESGGDLLTSFSLATGITPNRKHRINFAYTIDDHGEDIEQAISAGWRWIMTSAFYFNLSGNYRWEEENAWSILGTLNFQFRNR